jgi:hypothetical protein
MQVISSAIMLLLLSLPLKNFNMNNTYFRNQVKALLCFGILWKRAN